MNLKPLRCLVFAAGGAALSATPAPAAVTVASILGGVLTGAAGNVFHELSADAEERAISAIFRRDPGIDENHHILFALRQAHLRALEQVLKAFDTAWPTDTDRIRKEQAERFSNETRRFLTDAKLGKKQGAGAASELERAVFANLPEAFSAALAARGPRPPEATVKEMEAARREAEATAMAELIAETGSTDAEVPHAFRSAFARRRDGWFDLFVRDGVAGLKANPNFSSIWTAEQIARIGSETNSILTGVERIEAALDELRKLQEQRDRELSEKHDEILRTLKREWDLSREPPFILPQQDAGLTFAGRAQDLDWLRQTVIEAKQPVAGLTGTPGIGKSALAVHFASLYRDCFPDGVIGIRVSGKTAETIAREFAKTVGITIDAEDDRDPGAIMQSIFGQKRFLLIFDNADDMNLRNVLPGGSTGVIVTTRDRGLLVSLEVPIAACKDLDRLSAADGAELLGKRLGKPIGPESEVARRVVDLVGGLPLALQIVAASVRMKSWLTLGQIEEALKAERTRLSRLAILRGPGTGRTNIFQC